MIYQSPTLAVCSLITTIANRNDYVAGSIAAAGTLILTGLIVYKNLRDPNTETPQEYKEARKL